MFKNFYKIVFRNMWRHKGYTLLNIFGMGIGLAAIVWGFQTYRFSFSYDNFHKDQENVYRALTFQSGSNGVRGIFPMAAIKHDRSEFTQAEDGIRDDSRGLSVRYGNNEAFADQ